MNWGFRILCSGMEGFERSTLRDISHLDSYFTLEQGEVCAEFYGDWLRVDSSLCPVFIGGSLLESSRGRLTEIAVASLSPKDFYRQLTGNEGTFTVVFIRDSEVTVFTDFFGRAEVVYGNYRGAGICSGNLVDLPSSMCREINALGLAQIMEIFGGRPAKEETLYRDVQKLGVRKVLTGSKKGTWETLEYQPLRPKNIDWSQAKDRLVSRYTKAFLDAIERRVTPGDNGLFLSSGWDSTAILGGLCEIVGRQRVAPVIGRMKYSARSGICNGFEIEKAKKFAKHYSVDLTITELDYTNADANREFLEATVPKLRSLGCFSFSGLNHFKLASAISELLPEKASVFSGEISDGVHNFGFSQSASVLNIHSKEFKQYSDKMMSYLFGPSFLRKALVGDFTDDPVFTAMKSILSVSTIDHDPEISNAEESLKRQFIFSLFGCQKRFPFVNSNNLLTLGQEGRALYINNLDAKYFSRAARNLTPDNLYSVMIDLYSSFHWQSGTVITFDNCLSDSGLLCALPFLDREITDLLSETPESMGRGLEWNPAKYPLKLMLSDNFGYPLEYQIGPHSYLYDTDSNFSHVTEILYYSALNRSFKYALSSFDLEQFFDPKIFDLTYLASLRSRFIKGIELKGVDQNYLLAICCLGLYFQNQNTNRN